MDRRLGLVATLVVGCTRFSGAADDAGVASLPDATAEGGAPTDATAPGGAFTDDFNRADGPVANGWIEKTPASASITSGQLRLKSGPYADRLLYRPSAEDVLDVAVSAEINYSKAPVPGGCSDTAGASCDAQVFARLQGGGGPGMFDGYVAWIDEQPSVHLGRERGLVMVYFSATPLASPLDTTSTYRLVLRVRGTSSVDLVASVERRNAGATAWEPLAETKTTDSTPERIEKRGSVGVSADFAVPFAYDTFQRLSL